MNYIMTEGSPGMAGLGPRKYTIVRKSCAVQIADGRAPSVVTSPIYQSFEAFLFPLSLETLNRGLYRALQ
jgi:hypothetical protein